MKSSGSDIAQCGIRKNQSDVVIALSNPVSSLGGIDGSTNSVIMHLVRGDKVDLGSCSSYDTMYINSAWFTTFSGFLLQAD